MSIVVHVRQKPDRNNLLLYYVNPLTGLEQSKSAGTSDRSAAERAAALWEQELRSGLLPSSTDWEGFRQRFEVEHLAGLSTKSRLGYGTALNHFEKLVGKPREMSAITASTVSTFRGAMRKAGMPETSIGTHLTHLRAALHWAQTLGMMTAPLIKISRQGKRKFMRGRPLTEQEFKQTLDAVPDVVPSELAHEWQRLLRGLWLCGLRLDESLRLSWSLPPVRVDLDARFPRILWFAEGHKSRRDEATPLTPDFAAFLKKTSKTQRRGKVFCPTVPNQRLSVKSAGKIISAIGRESGVVVNEAGKHASAHDLRRSFGTRWAVKVRPVTLQALMRHSSIETTLRYYVDLQCDDVGAELWGQLAVQGVPENVPTEGSQTENGRAAKMQKQRAR